MLRLTTRSIRTAEAIRDREDFKTSGSLRGESHDGYYPYRGWLSDEEYAALRADNEARLIDYIVWSYATPIAWHKVDGTWHIVNQKFSPTTGKHQGNLYLAKRETPLCTVNGCAKDKAAGVYCEKHAVRAQVGA